MPLSEHEQRLLEQIERALVDDDPKFASTVRTGDRRLKARRTMQLGALLIVVGLALLVGGGAVETGSGPAGARGSSAPGRRGKRASRQPLKSRLEERFRRRYDQ